MLICYNCNELFDEWEIKLEPEPHGEIRGHCPNCLDEEFGEAYWCSHCGEYYPPSRMAGGYCEDCRSDLLGQLREAVSGALNEEERDYLEYELCAAGGMLGGRLSI